MAYGRRRTICVLARLRISYARDACGLCNLLSGTVPDALAQHWRWLLLQCRSGLGRPDLVSQRLDAEGLALNVGERLFDPQSLVPCWHGSLSLRPGDAGSRPAGVVPV